MDNMNGVNTYGRNNKKDYTGIVVIICVLALFTLFFIGYLFNEKAIEDTDTQTLNEKLLNNRIVLLESDIEVMQGTINDLPTGSGGGGGVSTSTLNEMFLDYYLKTNVYNTSETYNISEINANFSLYLLQVDQRYNETDLINLINTTQNIMSLGFYNTTEIDNNLSNYLLGTDQRYNDTTLINSVNTTQNIMSLGFYNDSYIDNEFSSYYNISQIENNLTNYLLLVDQRYNDTALINSINTTLNIMALGFYNTTQIDTALNLKYNATNPAGYISSYTDTNASNCANGEYLNGDGFCYSFNDTVNILNNAIIYNASSISAENHDGVSGTYSDVNDFGSGAYVVQELTNEDFAVFVNYTNVEDFDNIILRLWYNAHDSVDKKANKLHHIHTCLWDWSGSDWDCEYVEIYYSNHYIVEVSLVLDALNHIGTGGNEGKVMLKLQHDEEDDEGDNDHEFSLDYAVLVDGFVGFSPTTPEPQDLADVLNIGNIANNNIDLGNGNLTVAGMHIGGCYYYNTTATNNFKVCQDGTGECGNTTVKYITSNITKSIENGRWCS